MVVETSGLTTLINNERAVRENGGAENRRPENEGEVSGQSAPADTVSLSAEAIALARNVPPVGEENEAGEALATERGAEPPPQEAAGNIDIRV